MKKKVLVIALTVATVASVAGTTSTTAFAAENPNITSFEELYAKYPEYEGVITGAELDPNKCCYTGVFFTDDPNERATPIEYDRWHGDEELKNKSYAMLREAVTKENLERGAYFSNASEYISDEEQYANIAIYEANKAAAEQAAAQNQAQTNTTAQNSSNQNTSTASNKSATQDDTNTVDATEETKKNTDEEKDEKESSAKKDSKKTTEEDDEKQTVIKKVIADLREMGAKVAELYDRVTSKLIGFVFSLPFFAK